MYVNKCFIEQHNTETDKHWN